MSVYGIPPLSYEEQVKAEQKVYAYLNALIDAENMNPDKDEDYYEKILTKIAMSDLGVLFRQQLVYKLNNLKEDD